MSSNWDSSWGRDTAVKWVASDLHSIHWVRFEDGVYFCLRSWTINKFDVWYPPSCHLPEGKMARGQHRLRKWQACNRELWPQQRAMKDRAGLDNGGSVLFRRNCCAQRLVGRRANGGFGCDSSAQGGWSMIYRSGYGNRIKRLQPVLMFGEYPKV
jgi:hypothetical protein